MFEIKGAGCAAWLFGEGVCACIFEDIKHARFDFFVQQFIQKYG